MKYFDNPPSQGFVSLYIGKTIVLIAMALLGIFLPIFLYDLFGQDFKMAVIYYGIGYFLYGLTVSFGARFLNKFGFRRALRVSVFLGALFYAIFYFTNENNFKYLIPFSLLVLVLYRLFYWLPYHIDFAKFTSKKDRGRQVSILNASRLSAGIFIPLVAGYVISQFGFNVLFFIAIVLYLVSGVPYLVIPRTREKFSWSFLETWRQFFSREKRKIVLAYAADGAENVVGLVVWPIFIYQLLNGDYFKVGAISTLIIGFTVVAQLLLGKTMDLKSSKEGVLKWGSFFYSAGWVIKIFISTAFHIFMVGAYHSIAKIFLRTPFDALTYEIAADQGHYVDEFTVLHEIAINFGRTLMVVLIVCASFFFAVQWTFILAAAAAIVFNLLSEQHERFS
ncbi:MAG: MFS transporter [Patescibacteria group bacterium]|nr:MFS transporter [Patescibacteria group bacterium]